MDVMNSVERDIQPIFQQRWSPYVYDLDREVSKVDLEDVFEAVRWTMSAFNAQP